MAVSTHQTSTDPVDPRRYACETRVVSGLGVISLLPEELRVNRISKPALVVDAGISRAGLLEKWLPSDITNLPARILCPVNPDLEIVEEGIDAAKSHQCDGVIIIGGGSAICMGKAIAIMLRNPGHILDYEGSDKLKNVSVIVNSEIYDLTSRRYPCLSSVFLQLLAQVLKSLGFWSWYGTSYPVNGKIRITKFYQTARAWPSTRSHSQTIRHRASSCSLGRSSSSRLSTYSLSRCCSGRYDARLRISLVSQSKSDHRCVG